MIKFVPIRSPVQRAGVAETADHPPVAVCVPVRDEAALLPRLLDALDRQAGVDPRRVHVCLYFDGCDDDGIAFVRARAPLRHGLSVALGVRGAEPNAGRARAEAMALGVRAVRGADSAIVLSTDADSVPRPDWIGRSCHALLYCDVVAGRIVRENGERDQAQNRIEAYHDRLYALRRMIDPVVWETSPAHHFTSGASLGFLAGAYTGLGGFRPRPRGEDALIVDDAARGGLRVRRDRAVVVDTSSRRHGRAIGGLASELNSLGRRWVDADAVAVTHPEDAAWQWHAQAHARRAFEQVAHAAVRTMLADAIGLTPDHVLGVARDCPNAEAFAMRVVPTVPSGDRRVTLAAAERILSILARTHHARAA